MPGTGYGISIAFENGFFAEITDITLPESDRPAIQITHTLSPDNRHEFMPSDLVDEGELQVELNYAEGTEPPIDEPASSCVITFPSGVVKTMTAFLTNAGASAPIDDRMVQNCTLKITGKIVTTGP